MHLTGRFRGLNSAVIVHLSGLIVRVKVHYCGNSASDNVLSMVL